ncbi:MAG: outer membrane beta-barrel protein [Proteobacteria bacterium]|nr:outer membrane beta-barrel protein [Pseudomonadota bacterium]
MSNTMCTKITLSTLILSAFASSVCQAEPGYFLLGVSGGYAARSSNVSATVTYTNPAAQFATIPPSNVIEDYDDNGPTYGVFAGYQARCENWLLGGELSVDFEKIDELHPFAFSDVGAANGTNGLGWNGSFKYKRDYSIGFSLRMGYEFESLMLFVPPVYLPYLRAGVEMSKDTLEATYQGNNVVYPFSTSSTYRKWPYRFFAGAGCEFPILNPHASIRFEYLYHSSGQTVETQSSIIDNGIVNPTFNTAMDPIIQSVKIALVWNLN